MPFDTDVQSQIEGRLGALASRLAACGDVTAEIRDGRIEVKGVGTGRQDAVTCAPREKDEGALWFFDGRGVPIIEAANVVDAAVHVCALVGDFG